MKKEEKTFSVWLYVTQERRYIGRKMAITTIIVNGKKIDSILFELDFGKFNQLGVLTIDNVIENFKKDYGMSDNNFITNVKRLNMIVTFKI